MYTDTSICVSRCERKYVCARVSWCMCMCIQMNLYAYAVKKTSCQSLWAPINSNELNLREGRFQKTARRLTPQFCSIRSEILIIWLSSEKAFPGGVWWLFSSLNSLQRDVLVQKNLNSQAFGQRCRHSVKSRALTCPFKQSNLSAWSLLSWHHTHTYLWVRLYFIQVVCSPLSRSRQATQIMSTEALLLKGFS